MAQTKLRKEQLEPQPHYRDGCVPVWVSTTDIFVTAGNIELNGELLSNSTDSAVLGVDVDADYIGGSNQQGTNKWIYVYVKDDGDGTWSPLLYDEPPLYPTCSETTVFNAQLSANPASGATSLTYDGDTGEDNVKVGDILRAWTDATYSTVRCGWTISAIDTGTNTITVEANDCDAADNDYITIINGTPRYRQVSGVWYRCVGALRLNATGSGEIIYFHRKTGNFVTYDNPNNAAVVNGLSSTTFTDANASSYIPPYARRALFFLLSIRSSAGASIVYARKKGSSAATSIYAYAGNYSTASGLMEVDANGCIQYKVNHADVDGYVYAANYIDEL